VGTDFYTLSQKFHTVFNMQVLHANFLIFGFDYIRSKPMPNFMGEVR